MTAWLHDTVAAWPHAVIAPIVGPLMLGAALVLIERWRPRWAGPLSLAGVALLVLLNIGLVAQAHTGQIGVYLLGNWSAPFGIALALDRLSALMLLLISAVAFLALLVARDGADARGAHFHAFFQFQLMGLNGAFLTADLFNLFVFFEVLLISSYALLLHGAGAERLKASVHYVTFNLAASALFLIAVSLLYALTGTLSMADLAGKIAGLPASDAALVRSAGQMLIVVFAIKAALLPLYFWLPATYGSATAPVAVLFAVMTKVGLYSIVRTSTLLFGPDAGAAASLAQPWLAVLAAATLVVAALGALAAHRLRTVAAYTIVGSAGLLLLAVGLGTAETLAAALFYVVNSTLAAALMFALAGRIAAARPSGADGFAVAAFGPERVSLGVLFVLIAVAAAGLPPMSGFFGKALLLQASMSLEQGPWVWPVVLAASLGMVVAYARAGAAIFWQAVPQATSVSGAHAGAYAALGLGAGLLVAVGAGAGPLAAYTAAAAQQLYNPGTYVAAVLQQPRAGAVLDIRKEMRERVQAGGSK